MSSKARPSSAFEIFASELRRRWRAAAELVVLPATDSTNSFARRALEGEGSAQGGRVIVAWTQSAGRGRRGRSWASPAGAGVWASVVTPPRPAAEAALLPLLVPVAVCDALRTLGVAGCGLKWPNDLMVDDRKLGGFLIETVAGRGAQRVAILGIGVNLARPSTAGLGRAAVGLEELLEPLPSLATVACAVLETVAERTAEIEGGVGEDLLAAYRALTVHRIGDRLACRTASETVEGDFAGFDDRGFLRLAVGAGERTIASGEVVEGADGRA